MRIGELFRDLEPWNWILIPLYVYAGRTVVRGFRAPALAYSELRDARARGLEGIEGAKAPPIVVSIVERLLPSVAASYVKSMKARTVSQERAVREEEILDRLASGGNVSDVNDILEWGGKWGYLKGCVGEHVVMMQYLAGCASLSVLFSVPLVIELITPSLDMMPGVAVGILGGLFLVASTLWVEAALRALRMRNRIYVIVGECE